MIFRSRPFRKLSGCLWLAAVAAAFADPDAGAILRAARVNPLGQQIALDAQLRTGSVTEPFVMTVDGAVRFAFAKPDQELVLTLEEEEEVRLSERVGGREEPVRPARFDDAIRGSALTYEDLSLQFLYWKSPRLLDAEMIRGRRAWKIEVQAPAGGSQYGVARIWIDQDAGALMRVEGFNRQGRLIRRFEVVSVQRLGDQWMLKQMRVEKFDSETKKVTGRSYLEVLAERPPAV